MIRCGNSGASCHLYDFTRRMKAFSKKLEIADAAMKLDGVLTTSEICRRYQ